MTDSNRQMGNPTATLLWKQFLESKPPNSPVEISGLVTNEATQFGFRGVIQPVQIDLYCQRDGGYRIFENNRTYLQGSQEHRFIKYTCRNCGVTQKTFALVIEWDGTADIRTTKLGEIPPYGTLIDPNVRELLSKKNLDLYRKGLVAIDHGLGIGAASYFRRIVEKQWQSLVKRMRTAAIQLGEDSDPYDRALESRQFSRAVKSLKKQIPPKLLILNGQNPLTLLYKPLSRQLHSRSDEDCLQEAQDIGRVLTALLESIGNVLRDQRELQAAAKRLAQRRDHER